MTPRDATVAQAFDVREFARTVQGSLRAHVDVDALASAGLTPDAVHLARVLRELERGTLHRMRDLLVTATHKDARVTAFLTSWAFEKFWIADALDAVLEAASADTAPLEGPPRASFAERTERRGPIRRAIAGMFAGTQLVAAHVTTGLVDEWIGQVAYRRLAAAAPAASGLVERIIELKERHIAFLAEEAERRLAASGRAVKLTRQAIARAAWPIGANGVPASDRDLFERFVFGDETGRAELSRLGARLAALPGLGEATAAPVIRRLTP